LKHLLIFTKLSVTSERTATITAANMISWNVTLSFVLCRISFYFRVTTRVKTSRFWFVAPQLIGADKIRLVYQ